MPTINIPPLVRFVLYLVAAVALMVVSYAVDKKWAGDAEVRLVTGLAGLLYILAAAKTNLSDTSVLLEGKLEQTGPGTADVTVSTTAAPDESGAVAIELRVLAGCVLLAVFALVFM